MPLRYSNNRDHRSLERVHANKTSEFTPIKRAASSDLTFIMSFLRGTARSRSHTAASPPPLPASFSPSVPAFVAYLSSFFFSSFAFVVLYATAVTFHRRGISRLCNQRDTRCARALRLSRSRGDPGRACSRVLDLPLPRSGSSGLF